ncbi:hypothetical protein DFH09DRAFT_1316533 [Mycena vulgaris]|nr:hypothetical protein DFH09DRAFT_1316533 [Mycena vulgaris]
MPNLQSSSPFLAQRSTTAILGSLTIFPSTSIVFLCVPAPSAPDHGHSFPAHPPSLRIHRRTTAKPPPDTSAATSPHSGSPYCHTPQLSNPADGASGALRHLDSPNLNAIPLAFFTLRSCTRPSLRGNKATQRWNAQLQMRHRIPSQSLGGVTYSIGASPCNAPPDWRFTLHSNSQSSLAPACPRSNPIFLCNSPLQKPLPGLDGVGTGGSLSREHHTSRPAQRSIQLIAPRKEGSAFSLAAFSLTVPLKFRLIFIKRGRVPPLRLATPVPLHVPANRPPNADDANVTLPLPPRPSHDTLPYTPSSTSFVLRRLPSCSSSVAFQIPPLLQSHPPRHRVTSHRVVCAALPSPFRCCSVYAHPLAAFKFVMCTIVRDSCATAMPSGGARFQVRSYSHFASATPIPRSSPLPRTTLTIAGESSPLPLSIFAPLSSFPPFWGVVRPQNALATVRYVRFTCVRPTAAPPACVTLNPARNTSRSSTNAPLCPETLPSRDATGPISISEDRQRFTSPRGHDGSQRVTVPLPLVMCRLAGSPMISAARGAASWSCDIRSSTTAFTPGEVVGIPFYNRVTLPGNSTNSRGE